MSTTAPRILGILPLSLRRARGLGIGPSDTLWRCRQSLREPRKHHQSLWPILFTHTPLTDPTAHGGSGDDAFDLVLPSPPRCGFSGQPRELGWDVGHMARTWAGLMNRLDDSRYVTRGGDVGAAVTDALGQASAGLLVYFNEIDRGGHFAASEEPELFASELGSAFRPLR